MTTLKTLREVIKGMPPTTLVGITYDGEVGRDVLTFRHPHSKGMETTLYVPDLPAVILYDIVRFHQNNRREIIKSGLSRAEAQKHCSKKSSKGDTWFDGFAEEGEYSETPADDE